MDSGFFFAKCDFSGVGYERLLVQYIFLKWWCSSFFKSFGGHPGNTYNEINGGKGLIVSLIYQWSVNTASTGMLMEKVGLYVSRCLRFVLLKLGGILLDQCYFKAEVLGGWEFHMSSSV